MKFPRSTRVHPVFQMAAQMNLGTTITDDSLLNAELRGFTEFPVFVKVGNTTKTFHTHLFMDCERFAERVSRVLVGEFWFSYQNRPLRKNIRMMDIGAFEYCTIVANPIFSGGMSGKPTQITFSDLDVTGIEYAEANTYDGEWSTTVSKKMLKCNLWKASQRLQKQKRQRTHDWEVQASEGPTSPTIRKFLDKHVDGDILNLVEDMGLLVVQLVRARSLFDSTLAMITFIKLRSGGSLICNMADILDLIITDIAGPQVQADDSDLLDKITDFRSFLANWEHLKESLIVKRALKLFRYAAAIGLCAQVGIQLDERTLKACKEEAGGTFAGPNFLCSLLDTIALLVQRALMFAKTGLWETFFHGPKSYGKWFDDCQELKRHHMFIGNLEAHGTSYHEFVKKLSVAIETGRSILKFGEKATGLELVSIKRLLNEMLMIQASVMTYNAAQESRRPPFSLLVHGGSSVCKSSFVDMLFSYSGQIMNLPTSSDFKYTRSPTDPFWSGWNSSKWFVCLDDVAYVSPDSAVQDMSLMEIIQLVNDVPMVPNQASLEDKGKNPVRARFVAATTNVKHLNAHAHFACPLAVQRRLPFVVTLEPKPEFARADAPTMLDPIKLPPITDDWPDYWLLSVDKVIPAGEGRAVFENVAKFSNIHGFLDWLKEAMHLFHMIQSKADLGVKAMMQFKLCPSCNRVKCNCGLNTQADESCDSDINPETVPKGAKFGEKFQVIEQFDGCTWDMVYEPYNGPNANYTKTTTVSRDDIMLRKFVTMKNMQPVSRLTETTSPDVDTERVAMADVLAAVVARHSMRASDSVSSVVSWGIMHYLEWYMQSRTLRHITHSAMNWSVCRKMAWWTMQFMQYDSRAACVALGQSVKQAYLNPYWHYALKGLAVTAALGATVMVGISLTRSSKCDKCFEPCCALAGSVLPHCSSCKAGNSKPTKKLEKCEECSDEPVPQGLRQSAPDSLFPTTQKVNVWKRDDYQTSSFDTSDLNVSYSALPRDQLVQLVRRNVARIKVSNGLKVREGNALCVGGHLWVANNHFFYTEGDLTVTLLVEVPMGGVSQNVTFKVRQHEIFRDVSSDQAWFMVYCWSPKRDIRDLIRKPTLAGMYRAAYVGYDKLIATQDVVVAAAELSTVEHSELGVLQAWNGMVSVPTQVGDCGMPLVVHKPQAAILGLHTLGNGLGVVWATAIDTDKVKVAEKHFSTPIVQSGRPCLGAPSKDKVLGRLSDKAPVRWVEEGSLSVYGSFTEFKNTPRSKVRPTLLGEAIQAERGWDVDAVKPDLRDWRPWRHALVDVVQQQHGAIDSVKLRKCAQAYVDGVLEKLPSEALAMMQVLSTKATINGLDGVRFIDKMNFKSSMGEPYCKSKKHYMLGEIGDRMFIDEVNDRIRHVEACYEKGMRACPVFSGQLKDEPRSRAKVAAGKVRVFTGAPADWSFVVRKYLLTTVKVIQEHPYLFEASPGCTTQSLEWEGYFDFLTAHGAHRMIAGDYGKFDKKMSAQIILEAFWILSELLRAAGWAEDELLAIRCIAEDTAYAFVNFGGDLVEFFGSNPSGHPLTVIINCLVNALYMRYCYMELNPRSEVKTFKEHVNLLTYGDDNTMGVSEAAPWFNHTAIQRVLADIGVEYTMADKESESRPFIHIREVSYLKRTWRWDEDIGAVGCPLEEASIRKMLTVCTPSETNSPEVHMAEVICAAANEWFWYGKERFEKERAWLWSIAVKANIQHEVAAKHFPTWDELLLRFWKASEGMTTRRLSGCADEHPRTVVPK